MKNLGISLLMSVCLTSFVSGDDRAKNAVEDLEAQILRSMEGGMGESFEKLRKRVQGLSDEQRRSLAVAIRPSEFEWRFRGEHPAKQIGSVEYVVSSKVKDYESLLVVNGPELERALRFSRAFTKLRKRAPKMQIDVQLTWLEDGKLRSTDLWEIVSMESVDQVENFLNSLDATDSGLGSINLTPDLSAMPRENTPAQVVITVRVPRG